jgi:hypothetical protein
VIYLGMVVVIYKFVVDIVQKAAKFGVKIITKDETKLCHIPFLLISCTFFFIFRYTKLCTL